MRQVWILSEDSRAQSRLNSAFSASKFKTKYRVQVAASLEEIPEEYFSDAGVSFFVDAFSASAPGFEGLKKLRERGFAGPIIVLGEPAPEDAVDPFLHDNLTAFLTSVDRLDAHLAAGLVHTQHHFDGHLNLEWFLDSGGKSSSENIQSIKDFNQLVLKLMNFVSRFGVNIQKLKRALVGLSASHVKNTPQGPQVIRPFRLCYGIDANKLLLAVSLDSEHFDLKLLKKDFAQTLGQVKSAAGGVKASRMDFLNVAKITSNMLFLGGSAVPQATSSDAYLMTAISFTKSVQGQMDPYIFGFINASPSNEWSDASVKQVEAPSAKAPLAEVKTKVAEKIETKVEAPPPAKQLFEPSIVGDTPEKDDMPAEDAAEPLEASGAASVSNAEFDRKVKALEAEMLQYKKVSEALAVDVKRLMKERREPLTDADLQESLKEMEERLKRLQEQNKKLSDVISQKDSQLELLKAQVERLKMTAA
jgi:hypothetical protein